MVLIYNTTVVIPLCYFPRIAAISTEFTVSVIDFARPLAHFTSCCLAEPESSSDAALTAAMILSCTLQFLAACADVIICSFKIGSVHLAAAALACSTCCWAITYNSRAASIIPFLSPEAAAADNFSIVAAIPFARPYNFPSTVLSTFSFSVRSLNLAAAAATSSSCFFSLLSCSSLSCSSFSFFLLSCAIFSFSTFRV